MSREQLIAMARREVENFQANKIDLAPDVYKVPTSSYVDPERWKKEVDRIFRRLPLALGFSCELKEPGSYRALEVMGTPVLLTRGDDGEARAFVNMCSHRGAIIAEEGCGKARGFRCPYHAWSYDLEGNLISVFDAANFGEIDKSLYGLTPLPAAERAGMIWVTLTPGVEVDIDDFLSGYDSVLDDLGFANCHVAGRQNLDGPNWKVAYDGYRDLYHIPVLHKNSFGADAAYQPDFYAFGSHVRMVSPKGYARLADLPEDQWDTNNLIGGVWTIFPNISIAAFDAAGTVYMVSQMFPGDSPGESFTIQNFLHTRPPCDEQAEKMEQVMGFLLKVVGGEDYDTGLRLQKALRTGAKDHNLFGRNEGGGQLFHRWVDALVKTEDKDLPALVANGIG
jgi:nitrite reductase/ring-hydroxylating ferredoxin subunit